MHLICCEQTANIAMKGIVLSLAHQMSGTKKAGVEVGDARAQ